ncbi:MAG: helix-turn-helix transcriptional regulator [Pyrinomonadaceae bacterium]
MKIERFYAILGNLIQEERNKLNLSQSILGSRLEPKMTRASIANIEAGKQRVLAHTLAQLSRILQLDLNEVKEFDGNDSLTADESEQAIAAGLINQLSPESAQKLMELLKSKRRRK